MRTPHMCGPGLSDIVHLLHRREVKLDFRDFDLCDIFQGKKGGRDL